MSHPQGKILKWTRPSFFILAAVNIGGALEWYEIGLFISWQIIIQGSSNFLNQTIADSLNLTGILLMVVFSIASGGSRGLGGFLFGKIGDKEGRKKAFSLSILFATLPSLTIPLLSLFVPYEKWIDYSFIIFAAVKLLQGIPAGGEFSGAICYLAETGSNYPNVPSWVGRRYMCSYTVLGPQIGLMLSMIICLVAKTLYLPEDLLRNGWKIIFSVSGFIGILGFIMRYKLHETCSFLQLQHHHEIAPHPVKTVFSKYLSRVVFGFFLSIFETVLFIVISLIPLYYLNKAFAISYDAVIYFSLASTILRTVFLLIIGRLLTRLIDFPWLKASAWGVTLLSFFLYFALESGYFLLSILLNIVLLFLYSIQAAILPSLLAELFPTRIRYTGIAFSFNICDGFLLTLVTCICFALISEDSAKFIYFIPASAFIFLTLLTNKMTDKSYYK